MKAFALAIILLFAISGVANAAKPVPQGTIEINLSSDVSYYGHIKYDWTATNYKGFEYPLIETLCFQPNNPHRYTTIEWAPTMVFGSLTKPDEEITFSTYSSAWSWWVNEGGPTEASCQATLYLYPGSVQHPPIFLDRIQYSIP